VAARLQASFSGWSAVGALSDSALAAKIRDDRIDILIDLAGHTGHNRLPAFALKPAPVQLSWLGYPGTTGLRAMDYYLADRHWLPGGQFERLFTEKLVYLPDRWAFELHGDAAQVNSLPALASGSLTFGSFHRLGKITLATVALWSAVLRAVPGARLLLAGLPAAGAEQQLRAQFAAHGVEQGRLMFRTRCAMKDYLALHHLVDLGLDTLAYAGGTTTMHSLSMGVPTLTVAGASSQARAGAGILANVGLDEFVAADAQDFVARARYWSAHPAELAALRSTLRARLQRSPAGQPDLIAAHIEQALRHMWRQWCAGRAAQSFATDALPGAIG
jgi:predicted O-linked N-acetylglucosamine transferase (SPINDLY family)